MSTTHVTTIISIRFANVSFSNRVVGVYLLNVLGLDLSVMLGYLFFHFSLRSILSLDQWLSLNKRELGLANGFISTHTGFQTQSCIECLVFPRQMESNKTINTYIRSIPDRLYLGTWYSMMRGVCRHIRNGKHHAKRGLLN